MRVIMFQDRFAGKVRDGVKNQTIRKSARCNDGDMLSLRKWKGLPYRSKQEVIKDVVCESVRKIEITDVDCFIDGEKVAGQHVAVMDGFKSWEDMRDWFNNTHSLPFTGFVIKWTNAEAHASATEGRR